MDMAENKKSKIDVTNNDMENQESNAKSTGGNAFLRLPYGIAKDRGLSTEGLTPREVWELLKGKGVKKEEEEKKFLDRQKAEMKRAPQDEPEQFFDEPKKEDEYSYTPPAREYKFKDVIEKYGIYTTYNPNTKNNDALKANRPLKDIPAADIAFLKENRVAIAKEVNQMEADKKYDKFFSKKQQLTKSYQGGVYGGDYLRDNYDMDVLNKTFEKYKYKNPNYDPWDDGYTYPDAFPEMEPGKLIKALDESKAEIQLERAAAEKKKQEKIQAKYDEARRTGKPVVIKTEGGLNSRNFDRGEAWVTTTYAMPDGTTKTERTKNIWD